MGDVLYQPWIEDLDDLMLADMCMDWSGQLDKASRKSFTLAIDVVKEHALVMCEKAAKVYQNERPSDPDWLK
jgi:hypothetical protein